MDQSELMQTLIGQIRILNESNAAKDTQITALTEQVAKLTALIEELTRKKNSNNIPSRRPKDDWRDLLPRAFAGRAERNKVDSRDIKELG